jgi:hypothetical protein
MNDCSAYDSPTETLHVNFPGDAPTWMQKIGNCQVSSDEIAIFSSAIIRQRSNTVNIAFINNQSTWTTDQSWLVKDSTGHSLGIVVL